jgi:hypothetical protein
VEHGNKSGVFFYRHHFFGGFGQFLSQASLARPDFQDQVVFVKLGGLDDSVQNTLFMQKVLAELFLRPKLWILA